MEKVTGRARDVAEICLPGVAHAVLIGFQSSAGRVTSIDAAPALPVRAAHPRVVPPSDRVSFMVLASRNPLAGSADQQ